MKQTHRYREQTEGHLGGRGWGVGENGEETEKYRWVVTEQSRGGKVQRREHSQGYCNDCVWCQVGAGNTRGALCKVFDLLI